VQVPLFERGYEKDPSAVASEAIREASKQGLDAVLVDTAGRMQVRIITAIFSTLLPSHFLLTGSAYFSRFSACVCFPLQDNEPLMRALSKLINKNEPDLVS
jgi:signal recognition particle receptor subunit alpha